MILKFFKLASISVLDLDSFTFVSRFSTFATFREDEVGTLEAYVDFEEDVIVSGVLPAQLAHLDVLVLLDSVHGGLLQVVHIDLLGAPEHVHQGEDCHDLGSRQNLKVFDIACIQLKIEGLTVLVYIH